MSRSKSSASLCFVQTKQETFFRRNVIQPTKSTFPRDGGRSRENDCEWKSACSVSVFEPLCQRFVRLIERFCGPTGRPTGMRAYTLFVIFCIWSAAVIAQWLLSRRVDKARLERILLLFPLWAGPTNPGQGWLLPGWLTFGCLHDFSFSLKVSWLSLFQLNMLIMHWFCPFGAVESEGHTPFPTKNPSSLNIVPYCVGGNDPPNFPPNRCFFCVCLLSKGRLSVLSSFRSLALPCEGGVDQHPVFGWGVGWGWPKTASTVWNKFIAFLSVFGPVGRPLSSPFKKSSSNSRWRAMDLPPSDFRREGSWWQNCASRALKNYANVAFVGDCFFLCACSLSFF